jgi:hypothetical protein
MTSKAVECGARPAAPPPVAVEEEMAATARFANLAERITP